MEELNDRKASELLIHFPSLLKINKDMSNLDEIGQYMIKKLMVGVKSSNILYCDHAMVHYKELNQSAGAMKVEKKNDKSFLWKQVKQEFYSLICTKDKKYSKIRKKLFSNTEHITKTLAITVAAFIAKSIGVFVGVVSGAVATLLFAFATMGKNVYCNLASNS